IRAYDHRQAHAYLDGEIDHTRGALTTTYGEAYHYAEAYRELGDRYAREERLQSESGYFYARLRHERYLTERTRLSGVSSCTSLAPGQVLKVAGEAPSAFAERALITAVHLEAARDRSLRVTFEGMPFDYDICYRPPLQDKPQIAGTVPARVSSTRANDPYGHIDL
ncbi:contractile injection system protein, VgrG/Pvc8 family, partial [Pseudomonas sp. BJa5]|uniref:contractile injection system protein, VgrG/Pvc8 family n=1 Tax=Pseudomonas sp. BJa5 TaxID=2936270 RepID=UPI002559748D